MAVGSVDEFQAHRSRLFGLAYRMLGSAAAAEDVVQDTFLRWTGADHAAIEAPAAWLAKVATNLCLNRLASARVQRERYVGPWLPEPMLTSDGEPRRQASAGQWKRLVDRFLAAATDGDVTGGTGTLGRAAVSRLLDTGHAVRIASRRPKPSGPTPYAWATGEPIGRHGHGRTGGTQRSRPGAHLPAGNRQTTADRPDSAARKGVPRLPSRRPRCGRGRSTLPHLIFHATHLARFPVADAIGEVVALAAGVALPLALLLLTGVRAQATAWSRRNRAPASSASSGPNSAPGV